MKTKKEKKETMLDIPEGWKAEKFTREHNPHGMLETTTFATLFPKYLEKYIKECWPLLVQTLKEHGVHADLNLVTGVMEVSTTKQAFDPYIIIKARDLLKLLSRSMPYEKAVRVLEDECSCDIIRIDIVPNKERFRRRRQRIVGADGSTLKAIEILTDCTVTVYGKTVCAVGSWSGLKDVRKIVIDAMKNFHPIYNIKSLMVKRELAKDPDLKNENWERFLPQYQKKKVKSRKPASLKKKKEYTPFPPPMPESKVDIQLRTGEYFMKEAQKKNFAEEKRKEKHRESKIVREEKRKTQYNAPSETAYKRQKTEKSEEVSIDVKALKKKVKQAQKKKK